MRLKEKGRNKTVKGNTNHQKQLELLKWYIELSSKL